MSNENLYWANKLKDDEYYTLYEDVEKELQHYNFEGKRIFLPCDTKESAFWKYFSENFSTLKLLSLRALHLEEPTSYVLAVNQATSGSAHVCKKYLTNNGDFFGEMGQDFLQECDIVVTNPPFSRYREFVNSTLAAGKDFILIGNENSIVAKDMFPLFQQNKIHYGYNNVKCFMRPDGTTTTFGNVAWFTNLPVSRPDRFNATAEPGEIQYMENYEAANFDRLKDVPKDYEGVMGVPITYIKKHNPDKYTILGLASGSSRKHKLYGSVPYHPHPNDKGGAAIVNGKNKYNRVLIQKIQNQE